MDAEDGGPVGGEKRSKRSDFLFAGELSMFHLSAAAAFAAYLLFYFLRAEASE